jgi:hypothetical protein
MKHKEIYNGHQIAAEKVKRERGYVVNYQIDDGDIRASRDQLKSEEFALYWGIADAKAEIDRMTRKK